MSGAILWFVRGALPIALALAASAACEEPQATPKKAEAGAPAELAPSEKVAARAPPPVRVTKVPTPPLPDLPELSAQGSGSAPPAGAMEGNPCRAVWTGSASAPLACIRSRLYFDQSGSAQAVVPRDKLHQDPRVLPSIVDHRLEGTEGPVRNQLQAPACTAFATAAALDHALARWGGGNPAVSVMQIWGRYHSPEVVSSLTSNVGQKIGAEQAWPFRSTDAIAWVPCNEYTRPPREGCGRPVDEARLRSLNASSGLGEFTEIEYIGKSAAPVVLEAKLAAGQDVMVTIEPPQALVPRGHAGARYIPHYTQSSGAGTGHTMLIAGYAHFAHGTYFLLHNSWGQGWGDAGYAWIHEATLNRWSLDVVAADAEPFLRAVGSRPRRDRAQTSCEQGMVPDSIRASCAPPCPDHSPRHDGVCAVAGQCPAGFVNLTGACVLSAPTVASRDNGTGIAWTCGPGGCSYVLPKASDPGCTGSTCQVSCPAPDFILAKMGTQLVCIE